SAMSCGALTNLQYPLTGDLDEVQIWNRALTTNELNYLKHRHLRGSEDSLAAYLKFDEGSGTTTADSGPHAFTGAVNNSTWVPSGAAVTLNVISTNCLKFAGTGDCVSVPHSPDLNAFPF